MSRPLPMSVQIAGGDIFNYGIIAEEPTGLSDDFKNIAMNFEDLKEHYLAPITRCWTDPSSRFYELRQKWENETAILSSINEISMHPAYQQIIGMGSDAIPFIIKELETNPNHWFWALKAITGEDPVSPPKRGNVGEMTNAWLFWWAARKYQR